MNYVRLAARIWIAYVIINLFILFIDFVAVIFFGVSLDVALTGYFAGIIGVLVGVFVGVALGVYAAYKLTKWLHRKVQENAANKLRQLGFNVEPRDMGFLAHRYYLMLLPTPEIEEEFRRRFSEVGTRYKAAVTAGAYVAIVYSFIFMLALMINAFVANLVIGAITHNWSLAYRVMGIGFALALPWFLIGFVSGWAYASEELKTVVLRRPETTTADIKKILNAIGQGVLDAILY